MPGHTFAERKATMGESVPASLPGTSFVWCPWNYAIPQRILAIPPPCGRVLLAVTREPCQEPNSLLHAHEH
jgi:hypothetical protein